MTSIKTGICGVVVYLLISGFVLPALAEDSFTQADRERLVRVEATQTIFMQQVDKRFEQVDKRFEELRSDMNARFEQITNMFYALSAIFTTLFAAVFGFAWWDRRSVLITARKAARDEVEGSTRGIRESTITVERIVEVLRSFAEKTPDLKELMRRANLL